MPMLRGSTQVSTYKPPFPPPGWAVLCIVGLFGVAAPTAAQDIGAGQRLTATGDISLNYVDTRRGDETSRDFATQLRPGVQYVTRQGRTQGSLTYAADLIQHTDAQQGSELRHNLNALLSAQPIENWAYVDASASISRSAISAFGQQSVPGSLQNNDNYEDVAQVSLRPSIRGSFGGLVAYDVRAHAAAVNQRHSIVGDSTETGGSQSLRWQGRGVFGGGITAMQSRSDFRAGRKTITDRLIADLSWQPDVDWRVALRGGQEETNVGQLEKQRYDNWGASVRWTPNPRTLASVDADHRYFGDSWNVLLEHRFPTSALRFSSVRDANNNSSPNGVGAPITLFQLFFARYASDIPNPEQRELFVRALLNALYPGVDPDAVLPGGSLSNAVTLQRRNDLGWTYTSPRLTLALLAFTSQTSTLDTLSPQAIDETVDQRGYSATVAYRLTPTATASFGGSRLMTAPGRTLGGTDLKSVTVSLGEQIGLRTTASVNARYSVFNSSGPDAYREASVGATLSHRF